MPRILIFNGAPEASQRRVGTEGGASNEAIIRRALAVQAPSGVALDTFTLNVADGERLPQGLALADFDGVWISGSPLNVYRDSEPGVRVQLELARTIWEAGVPSFGSCWGLQLMTAALGGVVHLNPRGRELGIARNICLNEAGRAHALFRDKPTAFDAICSHEDEVDSLPACGRVLASNRISRVQAAVMIDGGKSFWGVQYHPEFEFGLLAALFALQPERHIREGLARSRDDVQQLVEDFRTLDIDPGRTDLAFRYGLGPDTLDPQQRGVEFRNWLEAKVLPYARARGR